MYNSQYYTCEQIDERLLQGYLDDYNTQTGQSLTKAQFLTKLGSIFSKEGVIDNTATQIGYYECDTAAGTAAKTITVANYALFAGGSMKVKFANKNTANNATLNINSQGAKALYYQGERASATNSWDAEEVVEIYYDGTSYYANNVKGGSGSGVYDVSKEHPTSGPNSDGKFTLEYILNSSNVNELIPVNKRYPGMTIQFVSTSDNKYVQYRYMSSSTVVADFINIANWKNIDENIIPLVGFWDSDDSNWYNVLQIGECAYNNTLRKISVRVDISTGATFRDVSFSKDIFYKYNNHLFIWDGDTGLICCESVLNLNELNNVSYYESKSAARNSVRIDDRKYGCIICYRHVIDGWHTEQFIGDDISGWATETNWQSTVYSGGKDTTHGTVTLNIGGQTTIVGNADKVIKIVGQGTIADGTTGVTQVGDIYYNTGNTELYRAINISTPLQSSDFEEVPKYEGALYRYGNALYFWDNVWNTLIRINSEYIIVLDGMWPSEDPRFYNMASGHYAYNTTLKKVAQKMNDTFRSIELIGSAIYYNKEDGYLYVVSGDHLIKKQLDTFNELSFNGNDNTLSDSNRFAVIPNRRYRFHIPNNIDMSGVTTTSGTRFHIEAIDNNGTITDMVNVAVGNNLESLYDVVFPTNIVEAYVGGRCSVGYTFRVVCEMLDENTLFLSDFIKGRWFAGSTIGEQLEERRDGVYSDSYSLKISVDEGQQYVVTLKGATAGRAWYTLDNTGAVVRMAEASFNGSTQITIEQNEVILLIQTNGLDVARAYQINGDIKTKCEGNKQVASNDGYRFLASNLTLTENINKTAYDDFRWGVGCKGKARFGNVVLGASSSTFADMKPITYEDGQIIIENNCMFFIHTTRGSVCGSNIVKMDITTYETELIGNIVYCNNNQYYTRFTTGSLMYDRNLKLWIFTAMLWEGNQHMYSGSAIVDVRYGHHILDVTYIDATQKGYDEDSFLYYDTDENSPYYHKYVLINTGTHVGGDGDMDLRLHTSDTWNGHYTMQIELDGSQNSSYTGAFINKVGGVPYVFVGTRLPIQVTPSDMSLDEYWILSYPSLTKLGKVNVDSLTGAWGGWGNVMSIPYANGTKYIFITFDRSATSNADSWTYGTTYIYEAEEMNNGFEYPVKSFDGSIIAANPQNINPLNLHFRKVFARKIYFKDWLSFAGIYPNLYVNNTYSNELELENATLIALSESIELNSIGNDEGFAMMGKIQPMAAIRLHLFNVDGMAEFVLANDDLSLYRKFQFEILNSQCQVKMVDKLTESDETVVNVSSFIIKGNGVDLIIGQYKNGCNIYYKNV